MNGGTRVCWGVGEWGVELWERVWGVVMGVCEANKQTNNSGNGGGQHTSIHDVNQFSHSCGGTGKVLRACGLMHEGSLYPAFLPFILVLLRATLINKEKKILELISFVIFFI
jgi:hypothetical protein